MSSLNMVDMHWLIWKYRNNSIFCRHDHNIGPIIWMFTFLVWSCIY